MEKIPESTFLKISDCISRLRGNSKRFVVAILAQNLAFNISGTLFFIGLGCSLKWWYKDQLLVVLLKQNLPALSEPQQKISWETGKYLNLLEEKTRQITCPEEAQERDVFTNSLLGSPSMKPSTRLVQNNGIDHQNFKTDIRSLTPMTTVQINSVDKKPLTNQRVDLYSNSVVINLKSPWEKHAYHRFVGIFPEFVRPGTLTTSCSLFPVCNQNTGKARPFDQTNFSNERYTFLKFPKNLFKLSARDFCILNENTFLEPTVWTLFDKPVVHTLKIPFDVICEFPKKKIREICATKGCNECKQLVNYQVIGEATDAMYTTCATQDYNGYNGNTSRKKKKLVDDQLSKTEGSKKFSENKSSFDAHNATLPESIKIGTKKNNLENFTVLDVGLAKLGATVGRLFFADNAELSKETFGKDLLVARSDTCACNGEQKSKISFTTTNDWISNENKNQQFFVIAPINSPKNINQEKLSYPLSLTKNMNGCRPPVEILVLSSYLDEIPYKLESTLSSFFCETNLSLKTNSIEKNKSPYTSGSLFEIKQLLKNELQILINSLPLIFINRSFSLRQNNEIDSFSKTKRNEWLFGTYALTSSITDFSKESAMTPMRSFCLPQRVCSGCAPPGQATTEDAQTLYINNKVQNDFVNLKNQPEKASLYSKFFRPSNSVDSFHEKTFGLDVSEVQNHSQDWFNESNQRKKYIDPNRKDVVNLTDSLKENGVSDETTLTLSSDQHEYSNSIGSLNKDRSRKKVDTFFNKFQDSSFQSLQPSVAQVEQGIYNKNKKVEVNSKNLDTTKDFNEKTLQNNADPLVLLNNLGITFNNLSFLNCPAILLPTHENASYWVWNKQKPKKVKIQNEKLASFQNFSFDSKTLTWQILQHLSFGCASSAVTYPEGVQEMHTFQGNQKPRVVEVKSKKDSSAVNTHSFATSTNDPTNKILFKQTQTTIDAINTISDCTGCKQKANNINPVDNFIKFTPKKVKLMSGYIYPDMPNSSLKSNFYRWIQFKYPKVCILPIAQFMLTTQDCEKNKFNNEISRLDNNKVIRDTQTGLVKKVVMGCASLGKAKTVEIVNHALTLKSNFPNQPENTKAYQVYHHWLVSPRIFQRTSKLIDNVCLVGVQIPILPIHAINLQQSQQKSPKVFENLEKRAAFPLLQNKAIAVPRGDEETVLELCLPRRVCSGCAPPGQATTYAANPLNNFFKGYSCMQKQRVHGSFDHHLADFPGFPKPNQFIISITQLAQGTDFSRTVFSKIYDMSLLRPEGKEIYATLTSSIDRTIEDCKPENKTKKQNAVQPVPPEGAINAKGKKSNNFTIDCSPRKTTYRGIVAQRDNCTKDFQSPKTALKNRSVWGTSVLGPSNPLTDRQSHFFGQRRLSTLDVAHFQRDYLRQLGKDTLLQSNFKGHAENASSVNRVKILSFSKSINSFLFKKRKYAYLLKNKDQWHLLFQEQLRSALEDSKKYPPLTPEQIKEYGPNRIKVSAPLMLARFPKKQHSHKVLAQNFIKHTSVQPSCNTKKTTKDTYACTEYNNSQEVFDCSYINKCASNMLMEDGQKLSTGVNNCRSWLPRKGIGGAHPDFISHYSQFTETCNSFPNSTLWVSKGDFPFFYQLQYFTQEKLNTNSWFVISQWYFLLALLLWIEETFLGDILPALSTLEQLLLGATSIKSGDRTHVIRVSKGDTPKFKDIAGVDGLLGELAELVLFLRGHKERLWNRKSSHGVLLTGPPGTGKTFIVRALANEAKVPVLILSAGTLTANKTNNNKPSWSIRHAFRRAKQLAPCILFIDEIDALGRSRGKISIDINETVADTNLNQNKLMHQVQGTQLSDSQKIIPSKKIGLHAIDKVYKSWGNEISRYSLCEDATPMFRSIESTTNSADVSLQAMQPLQPSVAPEVVKRKFGPLTQLLVSMDGVNGLSGVLVMGATNRPELLDPALTRPGRFERRIQVEKPAEQKRIEILQLYSRNLGFKSLTQEHQISWSYLANRTVGLTAADLAVAMNYSSLKAILLGTPHTIETIEYGLDSIARFSHTSLMKNKKRSSRSKLMPYYFDTRFLATCRKHRLTKSIEIKNIYKDQFFIDVIRSTFCKHDV